MSSVTPRLALKYFRLFFYRAIKRKWYLPEIPEITVDQLAERLESSNPPIILDLREKADFEGNGTNKYDKDGHIKDSRRVPITDLSSLFEELPKDEVIVTICPGGGMSLIGAELLIKAGFDARSLKEGIWEWAKRDYPLVKSDLTVNVPHEEIKPETSEEIKENLSPEKFSGKIHHTVDARNLFCPVPILRSKKALKNLEIDQVLEILTTDPGSLRDIPAWTTVTNQKLLLTEEIGPKNFRFLVKKTDAS